MLNSEMNQTGKPKPKYRIIIQSDKEILDFERELVGYVTGILDDVQLMDDYAKEYREAFWKEEFNLDDFSGYEMYNGKTTYVSQSDIQEKGITYREFENYLSSELTPNGYDLYKDFLYYFYEDDDYGHQTFYTVDYKDNYPNTLQNVDSDFVLMIALKDLNNKTTNMLVNRIKKFFKNGSYSIAKKNSKKVKYVTYDELKNLNQELFEIINYNVIQELLKVIDTIGIENIRETNFPLRNKSGEPLFAIEILSGKEDDFSFEEKNLVKLFILDENDNVVKEYVS